MKTTIITSAIAGAILLLTAASQAADPVYSVNIVGFQKVQIEPGNSQNVAAPFILDGTNTLNNMVGNTLDPSTLIYTYNGSVWERNIYNPGVSNWFNIAQLAVNTEDFIPGSSFIIRNDTVNTQEVVIVGEVVPSIETTNTMFVGLNAVANPYSSDLDLNDASVTLVSQMVGPHAGDIIYTYNQNTMVWERNINNAGTLFNIAQLAASTPIASGKGFLYSNNTGTDLTWIQPPLY